MMNIPKDLLFAKTHEWVRFTDETTCEVGISDFAQAAMGDIVYVNLPSVGDAVAAGDALADIESVKAVSDVYAPVSGTVAAVNDALDENPALFNEKPYEAWIARIEGVGDRGGLLDAEAYARLCEQEAEA